MVAQKAVSVASKGTCLLLKARFQTYAVFRYLLHDNVMMMS